jgi:hypothetical protein
MQGSAAAAAAAAATWSVSRSSSRQRAEARRGFVHGTLVVRVHWDLQSNSRECATNEWAIQSTHCSSAELRNASVHSAAAATHLGDLDRFEPNHRQIGKEHFRMRLVQCARDCTTTTPCCRAARCFTVHCGQSGMAVECGHSVHSRHGTAAPCALVAASGLLASTVPSFHEALSRNKPLT